MSTPSKTPEASPNFIDKDPKIRLERFFDEGTCTLITEQDDSGALGAEGLVGGVPAVAFSSDATIQGGAMGVEGCQVILDCYERALAKSCPVVGLWHSGGARLREGVVSLHAVGEVFAIMTRASGRIPQISLVLGPAAGGAAYGPALTDVVVLGPDGKVFVTGPDVVRSVTGENVDAARLGGPEPHGRRSGVVHVVAETLDTAYSQTQKLTMLLGNPGEFAGAVEDRDLGVHFPEEVKRAYDVHPVVDDVLDSPAGHGEECGSIELHQKWSPNIVTTLGRFDGHTVGVIANNPLRLGGCLDSSSAEKAARFVRMCDAFGIPLIVLVDVPGYLPGVGQEWDGVVRRGAKLLHAFAEATVPRLTLVTRKTYGGAYIAMNSRALGATHVFAWPGAEVAVMGAVAAVRILHRRKLAEIPDEAKADVENQLAAEHAEMAGGLDRAKEIGVVDEIVEPGATRSRMAAVFALHTVKPGDHGNIPL